MIRRLMVIKIDWVLVQADMDFFESKFAEMFLIAMEDGKIPFSTDPEELMMGCLDDMLGAYFITRSLGKA